MDVVASGFKMSPKKGFFFKEAKQACSIFQELVDLSVLVDASSRSLVEIRDQLICPCRPSRVLGEKEER
jgi:hypothetical protein